MPSWHAVNRRRRRVPAPVSANDPSTKADTEVEGFTPKALPGTDAYRRKVAIPVMRAVDGMPDIWRKMIHDYGYIDVYRAWLGRWNPERVKAKAEANGGVFTL